MTGSVTVEPGAVVTGIEDTLDVTDDTLAELDDELDTAEEDEDPVDVEVPEETAEPVESGAELALEDDVATEDKVAFPEGVVVAARATGRSESQKVFILAHSRRKTRQTAWSTLVCFLYAVYDSNALHTPKP